MKTVVSTMLRWSHRPSTRAYSSSSYPHIHHDDPSSRRHGDEQVPPTPRPVAFHRDARLHEQVHREGERGLGQPGGDGIPADLTSETRSAVPDTVHGEQPGGLLADLAERFPSDDPAGREPPVHQLAVSGLQFLQLENGFGRLDPPAQSRHLVCQFFDGGHVPS